MTRATLNVASKIHTAVRLAEDHPDGRVVVLAGSSFGDLGEEVVTEGVDREAFESWMDRIKGSDIEARVRVVDADVSEELDPLAVLITEAEALGIKVDKRWGESRLKDEIAKAKTPPQT